MSSPPPVIERTQPGVCFVLIACYPLLLFLCFLFFSGTLNQSRVCWRKKVLIFQFFLSLFRVIGIRFVSAAWLSKFTLRSN